MDAFPKEKDEFVWKSIQIAVKKDNDFLQTAFKIVEDDQDQQAALIEYV